MEKAKHITLDVETLGNGSNAPIVQIGAVKFNEQGEIEDTFERKIDLDSLSRYADKLEVNYHTIGWWFNQSPEAIKKVFNEKDDRVDLRLALHEFQMWIGELAGYYYWSHATFDPPILKNNYDAVGVRCPIPFRLFLDIRTLVVLAGKVEVERKGVQHDALDDCIYQAEYISKMLQKIKI